VGKNMKLDFEGEVQKLEDLREKIKRRQKGGKTGFAARNTEQKRKWGTSGDEGKLAKIFRHEKRHTEGRNPEATTTGEKNPTGIRPSQKRGNDVPKKKGPGEEMVGTENEGKKDWHSFKKKTRGEGGGDPLRLNVPRDPTAGEGFRQKKKMGGGERTCPVVGGGACGVKGH